MKKQKIHDTLKPLISEKGFDEAIFKDFNKTFIFLCIKSLVVIICFFIFALLLKNNVNKLAIISPQIYLIMLGIMIIAFALLLFYLSYSSRQVGSSKLLLNQYRIYQAYDILSFVALMIVILYFIVMFILTPAKVSGDSMENTYHNGDNVLVWHLFYEAKNDDVVIIDTTESKYIKDENTNFIIKRVIAVSGDELAYIDGNLIVNNQIVEALSLSDYKNLFYDSVNQKNFYPLNQQNENYKMLIPEGYLIVLGDNRYNSYDSTEFGLVRTEDVLGKSIFRLYPSFGIPKKLIR